MNPILFYEYGKNKITVPFISTWKTDNTSATTTANNKVRLPLLFNGLYSFTVDWGDSSTNFITDYLDSNATHTYSSIGTYVITITGVLKGWGNSTNPYDAIKLISIQQWGIFNPGNSGGSFSAYSNLNLSSVSDVIDLSGVTSLNQFFSGCTALTSVNRINEWQTNSVQNFSSIFANCTNFNQNISSLNISNGNNFSSMFANCTNYNNGGNDGIKNWAFKTTGTINASAMFSQAINFNQPFTNWNTIAFTNMSNMLFGFSMKINQNYGNLNISNVTNFTNFMTGHQAVNMSTANLDNTYIGWAALPSVKPNITITFGSAKRTAASTSARAVLTGSPNNWSITDGGI